MPLIPYDSFKDLDRFRKHVDSFFENVGFGFQQEFGSPRLDLHETGKEVIVHCDLPGLKSKEDVHIDVHDNMLTIHGTIQRHEEMDEKKMHRKERFIGTFERTIKLPAKVQAESTKASYHNGILEIRMPKSADAQQHRIDIEFH
ncbi:Hsp20/alpha crystallin family protein [Marinicrinis lubricantis]|uniref:Hsp20/alpha crystallin family protein n=1 Tax=Marinicrinis lubricantis TaxID=2086470 RepID=A0ABW1ILF7_9BACL